MSSDKKINKIIKRHLDPKWSSMNVNIISKIKINTNNEYKRLSQLMQHDFLKYISSIKRIQNPILYEQFKLKVTECELIGNISIEELYHCTSDQNVASIIQDNFDWRLCNRIKYGKGISFSSSTSYANLQSNLLNGTKRAMIVADVIVGKKCIGNNKTIIPDNMYDTTINKDNTVFVKYNDNEYYPKYVICYESYPIILKNGHRLVVKN